ncbi:MAG: phosphoenolpyruvate synthase [Armatimonadota bacterium]
MSSNSLVLDYADIDLSRLAEVGGKNASCGELFRMASQLGIGAVDGFATTAAAWRLLLAVDDLRARLRETLDGLDPEDTDDLARRGAAARALVLGTALPEVFVYAVRAAQSRLSARLGRACTYAVRSSATAEDLPDASFAGQHESYLHVAPDDLENAIHRCLASLFTDRALVYRHTRGFDHDQVALSVGVQPMLRSDIGVSGVIFTLDTETGFPEAVEVTAAWGLGEYVVQGATTPDEWTVSKLGLQRNVAIPIVGRALGAKAVRLVFDAAGGTREEAVPEVDRRRFCLGDGDVETLARWAVAIEKHYSDRAGAPRPMDLEFVRDGETGVLSIIQARPETVHARRAPGAVLETWRLLEPAGATLVNGQAVGSRIASGKVRVVRDPSRLGDVLPGEVLVAGITDPDWEPVMQRVAAIVTDHGGRTAHAAIVSRELGLPCIVGTGDATTVLRDGQEVTVVCAEGPTGRVTRGATPFAVERIDVATARTRTKVQLTLADPDQAFAHARLPVDGVGLARMEFLIAGRIGMHPAAVAAWPDAAGEALRRAVSERVPGDEDPREWFVRTLAEGIGRIGAAFHPRFTLVRFSDFKSNEYARLPGGEGLEPSEENPMIGFRGASRYADPRYRAGFALECAAIRRVREGMGLENVHVMVPFCRTVEELRGVLDAMAGHGLIRGRDGLQVWAMCEVPSNVLLAERFLELVDGFSIGSNDLTQLVLGVDRDSECVSHLYDERDDAVRAMIARAVDAAKAAGKPIGFCGQAPSDLPGYAGWLVGLGITSISLNPDSVPVGLRRIAEAEGARA